MKEGRKEAALLTITSPINLQIGQNKDWKVSSLWELATCLPSSRAERAVVGIGQPG